MMHKFIRVLLVALLAAFLCGLVAAQEQTKTDAKPAETKQATPEKPVNWYRVDLVVHELEAGKRVNTRYYTLLVADDGRPMESKTGSRVQIAVGSEFRYFDIGMYIRSSASQRGGQLSLYTHIDWSSLAPEPAADGRPVIRNLMADSVAQISVLGKPILVSSTDDSVSQRRYQVEATVTKQ
jgi:hypothetical protein